MRKVKNPYAELDKFVEDGLAVRRTTDKHMQIGELALYTRVATRYIGGEMVRTLDIGSVETQTPQKGDFTRLLNHMERLAHKKGVAVYVESILNEDLQAFLQRRGYEFSGEPISPNATYTIERLNKKFQADDPSPNP